MQTWTSSFWLTRREFFRALRPGRVLYLGDRWLLVKSLGVLTISQIASCLSAAAGKGEKRTLDPAWTPSPERECAGDRASAVSPPWNRPLSVTSQDHSFIISAQTIQAQQSSKIQEQAFLVLKMGAGRCPFEPSLLLLSVAESSTHSLGQDFSAAIPLLSPREGSTDPKGFRNTRGYM